MTMLTNLENISLIWYCDVTDETILSASFTEELRNRHITYLQYNQLESCINHLESHPKTQFFVIVSILFAPVDALSAIHKYRQIDSFFLFSYSVSYDKQLVEDLLDKHAKIIGIYIDENDLLLSINENIDLALKQELSFSFYNQNQKSTRELSKESALFLWFQLFKDVILHFPQNDTNAKQQLINYLKQRYHNNNKQLKLIDDFDKTYQEKDAVKWYMGQPFLYKNLNKALRTEDIEQLHLFRFFIADLCAALYKEYLEFKDYEPCITVYRGASIYNDEFEKLRQNIGELISTNGFLSTSQTREVALVFASSTRSKQKHRVLFEIESDLATTKTIVFASVSKYSLVPDECEVLFDTDAVFKIDSITTEYSATLNENGDYIIDEDSILSIVSMKATDEGSKIAKDYKESNMVLMEGRNPYIMYGILLADMGLYNQCIKYFERLVIDRDLLVHVPDDIIARAYNEIGTALDIKGEYFEALEFYKRAYDLTVNEDHEEVEDIVNSATPLANMAYVYRNLGDYKKSLELYSYALEIIEEYFGDEHIQTARILENIGTVHVDLGQKKNALENFQRAYEIFRKSLPENHLCIARVLSNIGVAYMNLDEVDLAKENLEQGLKLRQKVLPSEHVEIAISLMNIAEMFYKQYHFTLALDYYNQGLRMCQNLFPNGHSYVAHCLHHMGKVYETSTNYETALEYYEKAVKILQNLLPENHPEIMTIHARIDNIISLILYPPEKCFLINEME